MRAPVILTGPIPTVEEVARTYGVSPERTKKLVRRAEELFRQHQVRTAKAKAKRKVAKKNGTARKGSGQTGLKK
jgi:hypothetical protein